jgi:hypothetical protein
LNGANSANGPKLMMLDEAMALNLNRNKEAVRQSKK